MSARSAQSSGERKERLAFLQKFGASLDAVPLVVVEYQRVRVFRRGNGAEVVVDDCERSTSQVGVLTPGRGAETQPNFGSPLHASCFSAIMRDM